MSIHIGATSGEIAEIVLLPGDPLRAEFAAKEFLSDPVCYTRVRGMLGFTGTWKGVRVSIQGTGMGIPSLSIYVSELLRDYGARTLIRIGSCGSMQESVRLRDLVIAMTASTDSGHNKLRFGGNRIEDGLISNGLELTRHPIQSFTHKERTVASTANGHRVIIAVVFGIDFVQQAHSLTLIIAETPRDHLGLDKNVAGRTEYIEGLFLHGRYLLFRNSSSA